MSWTNIEVRTLDRQDVGRISNLYHCQNGRRSRQVCLTASNRGPGIRHTTRTGTQLYFWTLISFPVNFSVPYAHILVLSPLSS